MVPAIEVYAVNQQATRRALSALALVMLIASLGTSIANVALPTLAEQFDTPFQAVQWVVLAYLLAITTLIVGVGRLGDLFGRRRLLLAGIGLFTVASIGCGAAPTLATLIAARAAQGLGAAILMALALALVTEAVPRERIAGAMGLLGTMSALGTAIGPSLGGLLIDGPGWRAIFLINLPLGLAALYLAGRHLSADPTAPRAPRPRFDHLGTMLLAAMLACYTLAVTLGAGEFGTLNLALLLAATAAGAGFVVAERRSPAPLVPLEMLRERRLRAGLGASALVSTVMMATLVVGPFYLSRALALEPATVGLVMTAGPAAAAATALPAGRITDRLGASRMVVLGIGTAAVGSIVLAAAPVGLGVVGYVAPMVTLTAGYAIFQTANNAAVMTGVEADSRGLVAGMLNLSRNLGLVTGASVLGAVFALAAGSSEIDAAQPGAVAAGMRVTFFVAAGLLVAALAISSQKHTAGRAIRPRPAARPSLPRADWRTR